MRTVALLATAVVAGCAAAPIAPPAPRDPPTEVSASFGDTWDAVIDEFASQNIPIATIDRASGIVATTQLRVPAGQPEIADCGTLGRNALWPTHATYNVLVRRR